MASRIILSCMTTDIEEVKLSHTFRTESCDEEYPQLTCNHKRLFSNMITHMTYNMLLGFLSPANFNINYRISIDTNSQVY